LQSGKTANVLATPSKFALLNYWCVSMLSFILIILDWISDFVVYQVNKKTLDSHQYTNIESLYMWLSTVCGTIILVCCLPICCCSNVKKGRFARACCVEGLAVMLTFIHDLPLLGASLYIMHFTNLTPVCRDKDLGQEEVPHATVSTGTLLFSSAISFIAMIFRSIKPCVWSRNLHEGSCEEAACGCLCCVHAVVLILSFVTLISALWFHLCV